MTQLTHFIGPFVLTRAGDAVYIQKNTGEAMQCKLSHFEAFCGSWDSIPAQLRCNPGGEEWIISEYWRLNF